MVTELYTGKRRYRPTAEGFVLEVEVSVFHDGYRSNLFAGRWENTWRVATAADLDNTGETITQ